MNRVYFDASVSELFKLRKDLEETTCAITAFKIADAISRIEKEILIFLNIKTSEESDWF